jgi:hypothetical protein
MNSRVGGKVRELEKTDRGSVKSILLHQSHNGVNSNAKRGVERYGTAGWGGELRWW